MISPSINLSERKQRRLALIISVALLLAILTPIIISRYQSNPLNFSSAADDAATSTGSPVVEVRRGSIKKSLLVDGELRAVRSQTVFGSTPEDVKIVYL